MQKPLNILRFLCDSPKGLFLSDTTFESREILNIKIYPIIDGIVGDDAIEANSKEWESFRAFVQKMLDKMESQKN
jgi:hypothetical protein